MGRNDNLTTFMCRIVWKSGSLNLLEPSGSAVCLHRGWFNLRVSVNIHTRFTIVCVFTFLPQELQLVQITWQSSYSADATPPPYVAGDTTHTAHEHFIPT